MDVLMFANNVNKYLPHLSSTQNFQKNILLVSEFRYIIFLTIVLIVQMIFVYKWYFLQVIYVARNPKDVSVSYFHFLQGLNKVGYRGTFEDFFMDFISDKGKFST